MGHNFRAARDGSEDFFLYIPKALDVKGLLPNEFRVYCHLACRKKEFDNDDISEVCRMSKADVRTAVQGLRKHGMVKVFAQPNIYILTKPSEWVEVSESNTFEVFWKAYPRKIDKDKAKRAWSNANPPLDQVLKAIDFWKKSEQWQREEYIPHPTTWLHNRRWEIEVPAEKVSTRPIIPDEDWDRFLRETRTVQPMMRPDPQTCPESLLKEYLEWRN